MSFIFNILRRFPLYLIRDIFCYLGSVRSISCYFKHNFLYTSIVDPDQTLFYCSDLVPPCLAMPQTWNVMPHYGTLCSCGLITIMKSHSVSTYRSTIEIISTSLEDIINKNLSYKQYVSKFMNIFDTSLISLGRVSKNSKEIFKIGSLIQFVISVRIKNVSGLGNKTVISYCRSRAIPQVDQGILCTVYCIARVTVQFL